MNPLIYTFLSIQLLIVSWIDLKSKKISNYWHLLNLLVAILLYFGLPETYILKWEVLIFPVGFILTGFLFFLMGIMGAGDSKYLASLCLVIPLNFHLVFLEALLTCTMIVGVMLLLNRIRQDIKKLQAYAWSRYWQGIRDLIRSEFSYAPVILLSWLYVGFKIWT